MPVSYEIDKARGLVHTRLVGALTVDEMVGHFQELEDDPEAPASLDVLLDLTELEMVPDTAQLRTVTKELARVYQRVHFRACAIVALRDVLFGMSRMFEVFASERFVVTRTFRDIDEARAWLSEPHLPEE
jgi:hypothetical protein